MKETYEILKELFENELDINDCDLIEFFPEQIDISMDTCNLEADNFEEWDVVTYTNECGIEYVDSMSCMINKTKVEVF